MDKRKLEDILDKLQIQINVKGYQYWITAIDIYNKNRAIKKTTLYCEIAKIYKTTSSRV